MKWLYLLSAAVLLWSTSAHAQTQRRPTRAPLAPAVADDDFEARTAATAGDDDAWMDGENDDAELDDSESNDAELDDAESNDAELDDSESNDAELDDSESGEPSAHDLIVVRRPDPSAIEWERSHGSECHRYHGRRMCEGPRRVPVASEQALARQQSLAIDLPRARRTRTAPPPEEWVAAVGSLAPSDLLWPVPGGHFWRGFGARPRLIRSRGRIRRSAQTRQHEGVDIGAERGTPILAVNDALVAYSDNKMNGYGNALLLVHADGSVSLYAHCRATYVAAGEIVRRGQVIAEIGDTGLAHGPHLHFEWHVRGRSRNPYDNFVGRDQVVVLEPEADSEASVAVASPEATSIEAAAEPMIASAAPVAGDLARPEAESLSAGTRRGETLAASDSSTTVEGSRLRREDETRETADQSRVVEAARTSISIEELLSAAVRRAPAAARTSDPSHAEPAASTSAQRGTIASPAAGQRPRARWDRPFATITPSAR